MRTAFGAWQMACAIGLLGCGNEGLDIDPGGTGDGRTRPSPPPGAVTGADGGSSSGNQTCATVRVGVELQPVHLAFAFDVSGSMGAGDQPWHDRERKWEPVVAATRAFFSAPSSAGMHASLTFFPGESRRRFCSASEYESPSVPMTPLPSPRFAEAIAAVTPESQADWRVGTPTLAVLRGVQSYVDGYREGRDGTYALVLVTDGYPQLCMEEENRISAVVSEAQQARREGLATYVIGVANPKVPGAPDTVSNLHEIAAAGGTERAFLIDTEQPEQTASAFSEALEGIRKRAVSCSVAMPTGERFDKRFVQVTYSSAGSARALAYDPSCQGSFGFHYDDVAAPREIVLCPAACDTVRADPKAQLEVSVACEQTIFI